MELMRTSEKGVALIKKYEGCKLTAYKCPAGIWTIGYGTTKDVQKGQTITQARADELLVQDLRKFESVVNDLHINLRQQQFDALISWIYNLGAGNFAVSTFKKKITNLNADEAITDELVKWVNAGGKPLLGLKRRRVEEANMWLGRKRYKVDEKGNIIKQ
jgi:lysozyme